MVHVVTLMQCRLVGRWHPDEGGRVGACMAVAPRATDMAQEKDQKSLLDLEADEDTGTSFANKVWTK